MNSTLDDFLTTVHTPDGWDNALVLFEEIPEKWVKFFVVAGVRLKKIDINFRLGSSIGEVTSQTCNIPKKIQKVTFDYATTDLITKFYEGSMNN